MKRPSLPPTLVIIIRTDLGSVSVQLRTMLTSPNFVITFTNEELAQVSQDILRSRLTEEPRRSGLSPLSQHTLTTTGQVIGSNLHWTVCNRTASVHNKRTWNSSRFKDSKSVFTCEDPSDNQYWFVKFGREITLRHWYATIEYWK